MVCLFFIFIQAILVGQAVFSIKKETQHSSCDLLAGIMNKSFIRYANVKSRSRRWLKIRGYFHCCPSSIEIIAITVHQLVFGKIVSYIFGRRNDTVNDYRHLHINCVAPPCFSTSQVKAFGYKNYRQCG